MNTIGRLGEQLARKHLEDSDYLFVEANYHTRYGEIDLIMRDTNGYVFVEVKTRQENNAIAPNDNLSESKLEKMEASINAYLEENDDKASWRAALIGVTVFPNGMAKIHMMDL